MRRHILLCLLSIVIVLVFSSFVSADVIEPVRCSSTNDPTTPCTRVYDNDTSDSFAWQGTGQGTTDNPQWIILDLAFPVIIQGVAMYSVWTDLDVGHFSITVNQSDDNITFTSCFTNITNYDPQPLFNTTEALSCEGRYFAISMNHTRGTIPRIFEVKFYGSEEAPPPPNTPTNPNYEFPTPDDNSVNNTNQTINCTTTDPTTNLRFYLNVSLEGGNTDMPYLFNVTATGEGHRTFATNFSDGVYTYDCNIQNITNGLFSNVVSRTLTIDTVTPTITLNPNNAFNTSNLSSHNQYIDFMFLNMTFNDESGLFGVVINVTQNGISQFNHTNTSLNNILSHNFSRNVSTISWPDGAYDIEITVADGSTVNAIDDYGISGFLSRITFDTSEGNKVDIIGSGSFSTGYTKKKDRYEFGFNYITKETTRSCSRRKDICCATFKPLIIFCYYI